MTEFNTPADDSPLPPELQVDIGPPETGKVPTSTGAIGTIMTVGQKPDDEAEPTTLDDHTVPLSEDRRPSLVGLGAGWIDEDLFYVF